MVDKSSLFPTAKDRVAVALDITCWERLERLVSELSQVVGWFKLGAASFLQPFGERVVEAVRSSGRRLFLDLKIHDIPSVAAKATEGLVERGAMMLTVHASGGPEMIRSASRAAKRKGFPQPAVIAVTLLTSISGETWEKMLPGAPPIGESTLRLAKMALESGADGVVCSPLEVRRLREELGQGAIIVVPGIRPKGEEPQDQARFSTPEGAIREGADLIVVGRPITEAKNPLEAARAIVSEVEEAVKGESEI